MPKQKSTHRPPHIYEEKTIYFITGRTCDKRRIFNIDARKDIFVEILNEALKKYNIRVYAWVLLSNHYHLLVKMPERKSLELFIKKLHSDTAYFMNRLDGTPGRQVWYQYWDSCVNTEYQFFSRFNYIHYNSIKHGLCRTIEEVVSYKYCSYGTWIRKEGNEYMSQTFDIFSIDDYNFE